MADLLSEYDAYANAYAAFLITNKIPPSLDDDQHQLQQVQECQRDQEPSDVNAEDQVVPTQSASFDARPREDWMLLCQGHGDPQQPIDYTSQGFDWTSAAQLYPNLHEAPSFISQQQQNSDGPSLPAQQSQSFFVETTTSVPVCV